MPNKVITNCSLDPDIFVVGRERQSQAAPSDRLQGPSANDKAEAILEHAHSEARRIGGEAISGSKSVRSEAYKKGYQDGSKSAKAQTGEALNKILELASQSRIDSEQMLRSNEEQTVDLALAIARKIVGRELAKDRGFVVKAVEEAIAGAESRSLVSIKVSPGDLETLTKHWQEAYSGKDGTDKVQIIADPKIERGGCVIETKSGTIDARIGTKFSEVAKTLKTVRTHANEVDAADL